LVNPALRTQLMISSKVMSVWRIRIGSDGRAQTPPSVGDQYDASCNGTEHNLNGIGILIALARERASNGP
jgi:hypothetical protein